MVNLEVESIGVQKDILKDDGVLFIGKKDLDDFYYIQDTGLHTEDVTSLFYGNGNIYNDFVRHLLDLSNERVTQNVIRKSGRTYVSTITLSDGNNLQMRSDCSLPATLLSKGRILLEEGIPITEKELKETLRKNFEKMDGYIRNLDSEELKAAAKIKKFEIKQTMNIFVNRLKTAELKPISGLTHVPTNHSHNIRDEDYFKCKVSDINLTLDFDERGVGFVGMIKNGGLVYNLPFLGGKTFFENMIKKYPHRLSEPMDILGLRSDSMDCDGLTDYLIGKGKTNVRSVYVEANCHPTLSFNSTLVSLFSGRIKDMKEEMKLEPVKCFVKLQDGSKYRTFEVPYHTGISLWSKNPDDDLMIKALNTYKPSP